MPPIYKETKTIHEVASNDKTLITREFFDIRMRTKLRSTRPSFSKSSRGSFSATYARPLPSPVPDKNAEDGTDLMAQDQSSESDGDVEGDGRESKACEAKADGLSSMDVDWSEEKACIKCNMGGELLLCCGFGCPISLHGKCIPCNPRYDDAGKFYCPFCWYKLQLATAEELRKKALLAKKNLQDFMYCGPTEVDHGKEKQNDGRAKGNDSNVRLVVEERNKNEHLERMEQEKNNQVGDEQDEEILEEEDHAGSVNVNTHCVEEEAIVDGALHKSAEVTAETTKASEGNQVREEEKEQIHRDLPETNVTCTGGDVALNVPEMCDSDAETVTVRVNCGRTPSERRGDQAREEKKEQIDGDAPESQVTCTGGDAAMNDPEMCDSDTETVTVRLKCGRKQSERRGDQVREEKEEQIHGDALETNVTTAAGATLNAPEMWDSPTIARRMSCGEQTNNLSAESAESPKGSSLHPPITVVDEAMKQKEEVGSVHKSEQSKVPAKKYKNLPFPHEKRKRVPWKSDEEEMLKEGLQKVSTKNKNIPWRKILEFGQHVFHASRSPADLKDKWRQIVARESSTTNRRSS